MFRICACSIMVLGLFSAYGLLLGEDEETPAENPELSRKQRERDAFANEISRWEKELEAGRSLVDVVTEVQEYCSVYYPIYLEALAYSRFAGDQRGQIAQSLIEEFATRVRDGRDLNRSRAVLQRLRAELAAMNGSIALPPA